MTKHRIGKAQKRKRRNKQRHSGRKTKLDHLAGVGQPIPGRSDPMLPVFEQALPLISVMAMQKHRRKEEKREGAKNGENKGKEGN